MQGQSFIPGIPINQDCMNNLVYPQSAYSTYAKLPYAMTYVPNQYNFYTQAMENTLYRNQGLATSSKNLRHIQQPYVSKEKRIDNLENGNGLQSQTFSGSVKQRITSFDDQLYKSKKANKDFTKKQGSESKKAGISDGDFQNAIVIEDDEEIKELSESSFVIIEPTDTTGKDNVKNNEKSTNGQQQSSLNKHSERIFGNTTSNISYPLQKITCLDQSEKCDTTLNLSQNNGNKSKAPTPQTRNILQEKRASTTSAIPKNEVKENNNIIVVSDDEDDNCEFQTSQPKDVYSFQKNSKQNSSNKISGNNVNPFMNNKIDPQNSKNMGQCTQFEKLLQPSQKGQNSFISSYGQNQIPLYGVKMGDSRIQQSHKDDDITIQKVINPHKLHINDQLKATPRRYPLDISQQPMQFTFNSDKHKMKNHIKQTKCSSSYPFNNNQQQYKKSKLNDLRQNNSFSNQHQQNNNYLNSSKQFQSSHPSKYGQSSKGIDQVQSPTLTNNYSNDDKDFRYKKCQNSKPVNCKSCEKPIEFSHTKKGSNEASDLCKPCYQAKQKKDKEEKKYWDSVFRNTEDRQNQTEVGKEYQAVIPDYSMTNLQVWQQQNKSKFQTILANKVHNAEEGSIYTDVINQIRSKYNENYSHNDFLAFIKNTKMSLKDMKEKMDNDDQNLLNQIEACSSTTCKNQRVTRLTKRRLENLQHY